jgi:hypothetical protein
MSLHRQLNLLILVAIATGALVGSAVAQQRNAGGTLSQKIRRRDAHILLWPI